MGEKAKKQSRHHVLSVRVSDEDREKLEKVSRASKKSVSALLREVFATMIVAR